MSTTDKPATARPATAAQKRRAAKAASQSKATPIVEPPVTETGEQSSVRAIESAASKRRVDAAAKAIADAGDRGEVATPSYESVAVDAFKGGATIATIARTIRKSQADVRAALDAAGVDFTADPNSKAPGASRPASAPKAPSAPREWTLLGSFNAILAKKAEAGSKRAKVQADLAKDANAADLRTIVASLALLDEAGDAAKLAAAANAFTAALSAHYARVS